MHLGGRLGPYIWARLGCSVANLTLAVCCPSPCTAELGVGRGLGMASPLFPQALPLAEGFGRPQKYVTWEQGILGTRDPWKLCLVAPEAPSPLPTPLPPHLVMGEQA